MTVQILVFMMVGGVLGALTAWVGGRRTGSRNPWVVYGLGLGVMVGGLLGATVGNVTRATGQPPGGTEPVTLLTAEQFRRTLEEARTPVLVDFYADWCGPCRLLAPTVEQLAREWKGRVAFYKVNVDQSPELAGRMSVDGIPLLVIFANGQEVRRLPGLRPKADLTVALEEAVARHVRPAPALPAPAHEPAKEPACGLSDPA